jgi:hypothetical protein
MTYKVYAKLDNHYLEDYTIHVLDMGESKTYKLQRTGEAWTEDYQGQICLEIQNTGDGYKFHKLKKEMGYDEASHLLILMRFINWYEKEVGGSYLYEGHIKEIAEIQTIEI